MAMLMALSATLKPSSLPTGEDGASRRPVCLWEAWPQLVRDETFHIYLDAFLLSVSYCDGNNEDGWMNESVEFEVLPTSGLWC